MCTFYCCTYKYSSNFARGNLRESYFSHPFSKEGIYSVGI